MSTVRNSVEDENCDLLVIGCGAAGLSTAQAFVEEAEAQGVTPNIIILERAPREERGGATLWSWVNMTVDRDGVVDPAVIERVISAHPDVDEAYFRVLQEEGSKAVEWLRQHGVSIEHHTPPFAMASEYGAMAGGGRALIEALAGTLEAHPGVRFQYRTEAWRLQIDEQGRICGATVRDANGNTSQLGARAVVLATGGFEGSLEATTRYVGSRAGQIRPVVPGLRFNTGDGLRMAMEYGAATSGQFDRLHVQLVDARSSKPDAGIFGIPFGIVVNGKGRRFTDEGIATAEAINAPLAWQVWRDQAASASFIFDDAARNIPGFDLLNHSDVEPFRADTLVELAHHLAVDPDVLEHEVNAFNAAVLDGEFNPARMDGKSTRGLVIDKSNWAQPLHKPPYFAYPLATASTFSYGGIRTDLSGQVVSSGGTKLPGLYAAGVVTGVWYGEYPGAMSVLRSVTFARRVASALMAELSELDADVAFKSGVTEFQ